jgi:hypothetical protein
VVEQSGGLTAIVNAVFVHTATGQYTVFELPNVKVDCASSGSGDCTASATATATATAGSATAGKSSIEASAGRHSKPPVLLARWSTRIAPGHASPIALKLTKQGVGLLKRKHSLTLSVVVSVAAHNGPTLRHTLRVHLKQPKSKARHKR